MLLETRLVEQVSGRLAGDRFLLGLLLSAGMLPGILPGVCFPFLAKGHISRIEFERFDIVCHALILHALSGLPAVAVYDSVVQRFPPNRRVPSERYARRCVAALASRAAHPKPDANWWTSLEVEIEVLASRANRGPQAWVSAWKLTLTPREKNIQSANVWGPRYFRN